MFAGGVRATVLLHKHLADCERLSAQEPGHGDLIDALSQLCILLQQLLLLALIMLAFTSVVVSLTLDLLHGLALLIDQV